MVVTLHYVSGYKGPEKEPLSPAVHLQSFAPLKEPLASSGSTEILSDVWKTTFFLILSSFPADIFTALNHNQCCSFCFCALFFFGWNSGQVCHISFTGFLLKSSVHTCIKGAFFTEISTESNIKNWRRMYISKSQ